MKWLVTCAVLLAASAQATPPMGTYLSYEGQQRSAAMANKSPLPVPPSPQLAALRRQEQDTCAAKGSPAAQWAVIDSTLYLTHFSRCGTPLPLGAVYEGVRSPLVATWISGEVVTDRGTVRCFTMEQGAVAETLVKFTVDQGIVTDVEEVDNSAQCPGR
jgi:hypothetical protein